MTDLFNMGGYENFIWSAYIAVFVVLIGLGISSFMDQLRLAKGVRALKKTRFFKVFKVAGKSV